MEERIERIEGEDGELEFSLTGTERVDSTFRTVLATHRKELELKRLVDSLSKQVPSKIEAAQKNAQATVNVVSMNAMKLFSK